jgi:hypothetical protein
MKRPFLEYRSEHNLLGEGRTTVQTEAITIGARNNRTLRKTSKSPTVLTVCKEVDCTRVWTANVQFFYI